MYARVQRAAPNTVSFLTGGGVMAVGDTITQLAIEKAPEMDRKRTVTCASFNASYAVPLSMWLTRADRIWPGVWHTHPRAFVTKCFVNQALSSSVLSPGFIAWSNLLEALWHGASLHSARDRTWQTLEREAPSLVATSFCFWMPVNMILFAAVPPAARVLYVSTIATGWGTYSSFVAHRGAEDVAAADVGE